MANRCQPAKRQAWRERLERFTRADMTVAEFCAEEGVSVASFYQWRRKLESDSQAHVPAPKFVPLELPAASPATSTTVMQVDLPGGVRVRFEVTGSQDDPS
jgi:transposase-like protein